MKKKSFRRLTASILAVLAMTFSMGAAALSTTEQAQQIMQNADKSITVCVDSAQVAGSILNAAGFSADSVPVTMLCQSVQRSTGAIISTAENRLDRLDVSYQCAAYSVVIGGKTVTIDPFIVVA